jgi:hypothetical protein
MFKKTKGTIMSNTLGAQIDKGLDYLKASFGEAQVEWAIDSTGKCAVEVPGS